MLQIACPQTLQIPPLAISNSCPQQWHFQGIISFFIFFSHNGVEVYQTDSRSGKLHVELFQMPMSIQKQVFLRHEGIMLQ